MDIHSGVIKTGDEEIHHDFEVNITERLVVDHPRAREIFINAGVIISIIKGVSSLGKKSCGFSG